MICGIAALLIGPALALAPAKSEAEVQAAVESMLAASKEKALVCAIAADREKAALGDEFLVVVGVQYKGDLTVKAKELVLDTQSVAFEIDWSDGKGKPFLYTETHESVQKPADFKQNDLKTGDKLVKSFMIPTLKGAAYKIRAVYKGGPTEIRSNTITVSVGEGEEAKELGVAVETPKGNFTLRFFADDAPDTALHFVRQAKTGFYDQKPIIRIEPGILIQSGDPKGDGTGTAGYVLKSEPNAHKHVEGTVSMARSNHPDSGTCQFFVCLGPMPYFDGGPPPGGFPCTAFGEIVSGIDAIQQIAKLDVVEWKLPDGTRTWHKPAQPIALGKVSVQLIDKQSDQKQ